MQGVSSHLSGRHPIEGDSDKTSGFSARNSCFKKRMAISETPTACVTIRWFFDRYRKLVDLTSSREESAILAVRNGAKKAKRRRGVWAAPAAGNCSSSLRRSFCGQDFSGYGAVSPILTVPMSEMLTNWWRSGLMVAHLTPSACRLKP
jgi:hypothetical protein